MFYIIGHDFFISVTHGKFIEHLQRPQHPRPIVGEDSFTHAGQQVATGFVSVRVPEDNLLSYITEGIQSLHSETAKPRTHAQHQKPAHQQTGAIIKYG